MNVWFNLSLKKKLLGGFLLMALITVLVGGLGSLTLSRQTAFVDEVMAQDVTLVRDAEKLQSMALTHRRYEKDFFLNLGNEKKQQSYLANFTKVSNKTRDKLNDVVRRVEGDPHLPIEVKEALKKSQSSYAHYVDGFNALSRQVLREKELTPQQANNLMKPIKEDIYTFENGLKILVAETDKLIAGVTLEMIESGKRARMTIFVFLGIGVLTSLVLGLLITHSTIKPIAEAAFFAETMAKGDFTQSLTVRGKDEIGRFVHSLNEMAGQLRQTIMDVVLGIETLTEASTELGTISGKMSSSSSETMAKANSVAAASEEMSVNVDSVAAASEQTSTNVNIVAIAAQEMASTIKGIAANTERARVITNRAVNQAKSASEKIDILGTAAQEIGKVTETITEISEQTNLLALNATIEAARAGEAGKGFAVVANEIKDLARQTADATKEIKDKIINIQSSTTGTVEEIKQIAQVIVDVNGMVDTISTAVEEQSVSTEEISQNISQASIGIQEVNENVSQASTVTKGVAMEVAEVSQSATEMQNSSLHVNTSAGNLGALAERLKNMASQFTI